MQKEYDLSLPWEDSKNHEVFNNIKEEFLFRLNPHWIIKTIVCAEGVFSLEINDHETEQPMELRGNYTIGLDGLPLITTASDTWHSIQFFEKNGSLHVAVIYEEDLTEENEKKVVLWLRSIKEYLRLYTKKNINTLFFRIIMNKIILTMTPSQRKISLMLIRITILELLVILIILVGWFFFLR